MLVKGCSLPTASQTLDGLFVSMDPAVNQRLKMRMWDKAVQGLEMPRPSRSHALLREDDLHLLVYRYVSRWEYCTVIKGIL